jgi:hypothetical protein
MSQPQRRLEPNEVEAVIAYEAGVVRPGERGDRGNPPGLP